MSSDSTSDTLVDFDKLWDFSDPPETEKKFRELLPATEDASYRLQLLTQIARAQGLQREFDAAHETLDSVEQALDGQSAVVQVRYLLERGRVFNSSKQPDDAEPLFQRAWELACEASADNFAVDAAHMMGIIEAGETALAWNEKALALAENSSNERARNWLGSLYNNIGWTYHDQGDFDKALDVFEKAVGWREEKGAAEPLRVAKWCVARTLRSLGEVEEALARQEALLSELEAAEDQDGFVFEELAECHHVLGHADQATKFFALAYGTLSKDSWLADNEADRIQRLKELGHVDE